MKDALYMQTLQKCSEVIESERDIGAMFENEDDVNIVYDFEASDPPFLQSVLSLTTVTTFLAGFVASDFGGFDEQEWGHVHFAFPIAYVIFLSFAMGCCVYISIIGVLAGATYQRASNQNFYWEYRVTRVLAPIAPNMKSFKGMRLAILRDAITALIKDNQDWANCYIALGEGFGDGLDVVPLDRSSVPPTWRVRVRNPAVALGTSWGMRIVTDRSFPVAIVFYIISQAMRLCIGSSLTPSMAGSIIVGIWALRLVVNLVPLYKKLRD